MANTTLDLLIKARADFGSAKSQIDGLHQFLQGLEQKSKGIGGLIGLQPDTVKNIEALNKALAKTGQASKALGAIQFPEGKFRAAATQVDAMRRNFEQLQKTDLGKLARDLAKAHGQDVSNPLGWQWNKMTRGMQLQDAMVLRNAYRNALYQPGSDPHGGGPGAGGGRDWGAYGSRAGSWLGSGIGRGMLRTGGAIGSLALGGGIMGAMFTGYRENQQMLEGVDSIFKSIGGNTGGFQALKEQLTSLGGALQITSAEASKLAETFVRTSGAADTDVLKRAESAGQFGRGLGMDPGASAQVFGRAGLIGVGNSRQSQRDFASLMGKTIADSGMFARSEQVMEGMVGQLERIATTQGRTASGSEMASAGSILSEMLKNPALRGGGADSIMGMAQRLGNGGDLSMAMMAYGKLAGGDLGKVIEIANSDAMTPIGQLKGFEGSGITDTRADYMVRLIRDMSRGTRMDEGQFAAQHFGVNPELYRQYAGVFDGKRMAQGDAGFRSWMSGLGLNPDQVQMSGLGTLSDIYANQGATAGSAHINRLVSHANEYLSNGQLDDRPDLLAELNAVKGPGGTPQQLQAVMAKIAGTVGAPLTEADKARQAQADLITALGKLGGFVNELVVAIKEGLTPGVLRVAEWLDRWFGDDEEEPAAPYEGTSQQRIDDFFLEQRRADGTLDENNEPVRGREMTSFDQEQYRMIMERRAQAAQRAAGAGAPGAGGAPAPGAGSRPGNFEWNVSAPNSGVTGGAAATGAAPAVSGDGNYDLGSQEWRDYLAGLDSQHGFAPGTMMSLAQQESSNQALGYHYPEGPDGRRRARNGRVSTASGIFGILNSTASDPGYGVSPLPGPAYQQSPAAQAQFAAEYLAARTNAAGGQLAGLAAYGEGAGYANQVAGRAASATAQAPAAPVVAPPATAPAAPVTAASSGAPAHAVDLVGLAPAQELTGPREQNVGVSVVGDRPISDEERAAVQRSVREQEAKDAAAKAQTAPPTPDPVIGMSTPKSADARVGGQVAININVAKDGKPVSESFRALSFGEPRVPGSGGTAPARNRVEWSNTV